MDNLCLNCKVCDGRGCRSRIPGPGAKGVGDTAIRNYDKWKEIRVNMDTIVPNEPASTEAALFDRTFAAPIFAGPVGAVAMHYNDMYDDLSYGRLLIETCRRKGIAAFTGDGMDSRVMESSCEVIRAAEGCGVPTVKPWNRQMVAEKLALTESSGCFAVAMDVDAAGLPFLKNFEPPAGSKSVEELGEIVTALKGKPFIVKGIMTPAGARKAKEAGASAIVVSNHGGRVLDQCPATAEVLPEIADAVGGSMTILVDGGLRTGTDIFKALAMGADGVLIARPFVTAAYYGGEAAMEALIDRLIAELKDTMVMCGARSLAEITRDMVRI
ncbi:MAG: alpha-hydroxy-acid oxidizing protein [Eubacterium sp.]|nr:alpha-hydroxy-acid oxidizing protein [Eubacterium sp.]